MIKKATITGIFFSIILVFAIFAGFYAWIDLNAKDSGVTIDAKYSNISDELNVQQDNLDKTITEIRNATENIVEPESGFLQAMNGLKGLLSVLKLPLNILGVSGEIYYISSDLIEPSTWVKSLALLSIIALIILVIVAVLKGEPKM